MVNYLAFYNSVMLGVFCPARGQVDSNLILDCFWRGYSVEVTAQIVEADVCDAMAERD